MKKQLIMSIRPEHLVNILNGEKILEIRKTIPKDFKKGWVNLYCSKSKKNFYLHNLGHPTDLLYKNQDNIHKVGDGFETVSHSSKATFLNGTIPCRFWFDEYTTLCLDYATPHLHNVNKEILKKLCLKANDVEDYSWNGFTYKDLYAWHIKNLEIFDEPKELSDFYKINNTKITKAPQSWMYCYTLHSSIGHVGNIKIK